MRDTQLYQRVLGLEEPWSVSRVELKLAEKRVDVWVDHRPGVKWMCPHCGEESDDLWCRDHAGERAWRHLDTCQFQTYLHARIPRVDCPEHGVVNVSVPWAEAHSRFTLLMESWIIEVLLECRAIESAGYLTGLSWDEVSGVMQRAVARGQARKKDLPLRHLGVDEKAFRKGHSYMTVVCDLDRSTVEYVAENRTAASLAGYFQALDSRRLAAIEAVAMDMWEPYVQATLEHVPLAAEKIVFDRFHIMKHMNEAVDAVRREEHRTLTAQDDETLKGTKHWWLYGRENVPDPHRRAFRRLKDRNLRTSRAWAMKETLRNLWSYGSMTWARKFFDAWRRWVNRSRLEPVQEVARMLQRRIGNVLTYCKHHVTNAVAEGLNSKIMALQRRACGYRNKEHFKTAIYFFCGGLDLCPR
ncbi:MAG: ISL3 family transposase [Nitrospiraceae bacterium]